MDETTYFSRSRVNTWAAVSLLALIAWAMTNLGAMAMNRGHYPTGDVVYFLAALTPFTGAAAVVLARGRVLTATAIAAAPFLVTVFTSNWIWAWWLTLVLVAVAGVWKDWKRALVPTALACAVGAQFAYLGTTAFVLDGFEVTMHARWGAGDKDMLIILLLYVAASTVPVLVSGALAATLRSQSATRQATTQTRKAVEVSSASAERARLARDLHDVVAHHVSLIAVRAETAPYTTPQLGVEARGVLADIADDARRALDELRAVLGVLKRADDAHPDLAPQPGLGDIIELVERTRAAGQEVSLRGDTTGAVPGAIGYVAYRVVQEALTNARRHAPDTPVGIDIGVEDDRLLIVVSNPLTTDPPVDRADGVGLIGMRERVEALDGTMTCDASNRAFVVHTTLPLSR